MMSTNKQFVCTFLKIQSRLCVIIGMGAVRCGLGYNWMTFFFSFLMLLFAYWILIGLLKTPITLRVLKKGHSDSVFVLNSFFPHLFVALRGSLGGWVIIETCDRINQTFNYLLQM